MAVAVFYLVRWWQKERPRDLYLGALFTALGLLTKSSAYALVPVRAALLVDPTRCEICPHRGISLPVSATDAMAPRFDALCAKILDLPARA